jgi:secreted Zn-dependent insulinase-like peptidase
MNILERIKLIKPSDNIIYLKIEDYKEYLKNISNISPWAFTNMIISEMMYKYNYNYLDLLKNIDYLTLPLIKERIESLINMNYQTITIIYGNINPPKLHNINNQLNNIKLIKDILPFDLTIKHPNKQEKNKCVQVIFYCGKDYDPLLVAKILLLHSLLERPVFDILRTKHQLGYLVNSFISSYNNYYISIKVQSEYSTDIILKKIEEFMLDFKDLLKTFNLEEYKESIYSILTQKHTNMEQMANEYINEIYNRKFIFGRKKQIAKVIHSIQLSDIEKLYQLMLDNKTIVKIN